MGGGRTLFFKIGLGRRILFLCSKMEAQRLVFSFGLKNNGFPWWCAGKFWPLPYFLKYTPVSVIRKQGKKSPDPGYSICNQMDAGSAISYCKINPESVSSEIKITGWRRKAQTGSRRKQFLDRIDYFRPFLLLIFSGSIWADDSHKGVSNPTLPPTPGHQEYFNDFVNKGAWPNWLRNY